MNNARVWVLKFIQPLRPNSIQIGLDWLCYLAGRSKIVFLFLFLFYDHSLMMKNVETHAITFFIHIISPIAGVSKLGSCKSWTRPVSKGRLCWLFKILFITSPLFKNDSLSLRFFPRLNQMTQDIIITKVCIFWEGHKNMAKSPNLLWCF